MIIDSDTHTAYFSDLLVRPPYRPAFQRIAAILEEENIAYQLLKGTKDIWARDYMPIQVNKNKLVQFRYDPSYLKKQRGLKTIPSRVHQLNGFEVEHSNLNIDGGNVVRWKDKVILTDRVFDENADRTRPAVLTELENKLDAEIIIIPQHKDDLTGHSDGMIRFINSNTVLVNDMNLEEPIWAKSFEKVLVANKLDYVNLPFIESKHGGAIGLYINYLEIAGLIMVPIYEITGNKDQEALDIIKRAFSGRTVRPVNVNEVAKDGGVLNCISWGN